MIASRVNALLQSRWMFYIGAAGVTYIFWWSGLTKLWNFTQTQAEMAHFGLNPPFIFALATIAVQLGGSAMTISGGRFAWLGASMLAAFTLVTIPLAHDYWNREGEIAFLEKTIAQEHIGVIGGLVLAAILAGVGAERARSGRR